jgi:hypothetical protein
MAGRRSPRFDWSEARQRRLLALMQTGATKETACEALGCTLWQLNAHLERAGLSLDWRAYKVLLTSSGDRDRARRSRDKTPA